jgi:hypothetical protein
VRGIGEVIGAIALLAVAVVCWNLGVTDSTFAAVAGGQPEFVSTRYSGSWITTATFCVLVALLLSVDAVRWFVRRRSHTR